jgi:hypothetical protein
MSAESLERQGLVFVGGPMSTRPLPSCMSCARRNMSAHLFRQAVFLYRERPQLGGEIKIAQTSFGRLLSTRCGFPVGHAFAKGEMAFP